MVGVEVIIVPIQGVPEGGLERYNMDSVWEVVKQQRLSHSTWEILIVALVMLVSGFGVDDTTQKMINHRQLHQQNKVAAANNNYKKGSTSSLSSSTSGTSNSSIVIRLLF